MNNNIDKFNSLINKVLSKHYQVRNDSKVKSKAKKRKIENDVSHYRSKKKKRLDKKPNVS